MKPIYTPIDGSSESSLLGFGQNVECRRNFGFRDSLRPTKLRADVLE
jgi:hypothetical protein